MSARTGDDDRVDVFDLGAQVGNDGALGDLPGAVSITVGNLVNTYGYAV